MKSILSTLALIISSGTVFALPPAGAPSLVKILPTTKVYSDAMSQLIPTGEVSIAFFNKSELPANLREGNCGPLLYSRGGSMAKVTVPVDGGEVVMYFGDFERGSDNLVLCQ